MGKRKLVSLLHSHALRGNEHNHLTEGRILSYK
jgi:hypothetical protein